jgi:hypothetical protein
VMGQALSAAEDRKIADLSIQESGVVVKGGFGPDESILTASALDQPNQPAEFVAKRPNYTTAVPI